MNNELTSTINDVKSIENQIYQHCGDYDISKPDTVYDYDYAAQRIAEKTKSKKLRRSILGIQRQLWHDITNLDLYESDYQDVTPEISKELSSGILRQSERNAVDKEIKSRNDEASKEYESEKRLLHHIKVSKPKMPKRPVFHTPKPSKHKKSKPHKAKKSSKKPKKVTKHGKMTKRTKRVKHTKPVKHTRRVKHASHAKSGIERAKARQAAFSKYRKSLKRYHEAMKGWRFRYKRHNVALGNAISKLPLASKDKHGFLLTSRRSAQKMARALLQYHELHKQVEDFDKQSDKENPGERPFKYHGKTYYLPKEDVDLDHGRHARHVIRSIEKTKSKEKACSKIASSLYGSLYNKTIGIDKKDSPKHQHLDKAFGKYAFRIQKDRVMQEYHHHQFELAERHYRHLLKPNNETRRKLNRCQAKINHYLAHHKSIKSRSSKRFRDLIKNRSHYKREISRSSRRSSRRQRRVKRRIDAEKRRTSKWKNRADKLVSGFGTVAQKRKSAKDNYYNIRHLMDDTRYKNFGYLRPLNPEGTHSYVFFMVTDESPTHETDVASNPVEWGSNITTGTQMQATQVSIQGYLFNLGESEYYYAGAKMSKKHYSKKSMNRFYKELILQAEEIGHWSDAGAVMYYSGQNYYPECLISSFNPDYSNSSDSGSLTTISFSMTLTLCHFFQSNEQQKSKGKSKNVGRKPRKRGRRHGHKSRRHKKVNHHRHSKKAKHKRVGYVRVKSGMTYTSIARRKHVKVSTLRKMNKWPATRIPVGAKVRY